MIGAFFTSLFARVQGWAVAALAILAAIGSAFLVGRNKGSQTAREKARAEKLEADAAALRESVQAAKERNDVDIEISSLPDAAVSDGLREWMRDGPADTDKNN